MSLLIFFGRYSFDHFSTFETLNLFFIFSRDMINSWTSYTERVL